MFLGNGLTLGAVLFVTMDLRYSNSTISDLIKWSFCGNVAIFILFLMRWRVVKHPATPLDEIFIQVVGEFGFCTVTMPFWKRCSYSKETVTTVTFKLHVHVQVSTIQYSTVLKRTDWNGIKFFVACELLTRLREKEKRNNNKKIV